MSVFILGMLIGVMCQNFIAMYVVGMSERNGRRAERKNREDAS